jgi:hypothetical protein
MYVSTCRHEEMGERNINQTIPSHKPDDTFPQTRQYLPTNLMIPSLNLMIPSIKPSDTFLKPDDNFQQT